MWFNHVSICCRGSSFWRPLPLCSSEDTEGYLLLLCGSEELAPLASKWNKSCVFVPYVLKWSEPINSCHLFWQNSACKSIQVMFRMNWNVPVRTTWGGRISFLCLRQLLKTWRCIHLEWPPPHPDSHWVNGTVESTATNLVSLLVDEYDSFRCYRLANSRRCITASVCSDSGPENKN